MKAPCGIRVPSVPLPLLLALTGGAVLAGCGDWGDPATSGGDAGGELVLQGQVEGFTGGAQSFGPANWTFGEGEIQEDGSFTVTLFGTDVIEPDDLRSMNPESGLAFYGFACQDEVYDQVGADHRFAVVTALTYDTGINEVGLTSSKLDGTLPVPIREGTHVRWIFSEEPVNIHTACRDGEREVDLQLDAGWNEMVIEVERPEYDSFYDQHTGPRPDNVAWRLGS